MNSIRMSVVRRDAQKAAKQDASEELLFLQLLFRRFISLMVRTTATPTTFMPLDAYDYTTHQKKSGHGILELILKP